MALRNPRGAGLHPAKFPGVSFRRKPPSRAALSLVELMIAVAILADLLIIAVPAFIRARNISQNTKFITDLRTGAAAFEMYAAEMSRYPANAEASVIPAGMAVYLNGMAWSSFAPVGGRWDWEPTANFPAQLGVNYTGGPGTADDARMTEVDARMDNGALTTGGFRKLDSTSYMHILE